MAGKPVGRPPKVQPKGEEVEEVAREPKEFPCTECTAYFKTNSQLGAHVTNVHRRIDREEQELGEKGQLQEQFIRILRDSGVAPSRADVIARIFFRHNTNNLTELFDLMTTSGVSPYSKNLVMRDWSSLLGIELPDELMTDIERERKETAGSTRRPPKDEKPEDIFDMSEMEKSMKSMFKMQQYRAMMEFFSSFNRPNAAPNGYAQSPQATQMPYIDPKTGEIKTMQVQGGVDPMVFMMLMQQSNKKETDFTTELLKYEKLMRVMNPTRPNGNDKEINDIKLEMVRTNAERERKATEEKAKMEQWLNEFKHVLEKSKIETEFTNKLSRLEDQMKDARSRGDLSSELGKYQELKKVLTSFAESEGMKKGEGEDKGGINWGEMISKGFQTMDSYFQAQAQRPPAYVQMTEMPGAGPDMTDEDLRRNIAAQENLKHPFDYENDFGGVKFDPRTANLNRDDLNRTDNNASPGSSQGPPGATEP